jgi:hypothetical protein
MRPYLLRAILAAAALTPLSALAQMHKVAKPEQVVRAVGVYEWTGDFTKPAASRLIPVTVFIDGQLQDAGVYVARPVPFALLSGNVYELQDAGIDKGMLDLAYARHLQATDAAGDSAYDDGWFGYGSVKPLAVPKKTVAALKPSKTLPVLQSSVKDTKSTADSTDPDRPTMKRRDNSSAAPASTSTNTTSTTSTQTSSTPSDDPDRPTMKRRDSSDTSSTATSSTTSASSTPADDPDRPTMTRRSTDSSTDSTTASSGSTTTSASDPSNDPDRPTLKRRTPEEARKAHNDSNSVTGTDSLNNDPDRPNLHYGKPTHSLTETDLPKLVGLPVNLHQMVAVSDAVNRDPHPFTLAWDDAAQRATVLQKMQDLARAQLAAYDNPAKSAATPPVKKPVSTRPAHPAAKPTPSVALTDEELKAYTLSYGGDPTYIYSAHTAGTGAALRYVTIVAQANGLGDIKPAIQNVTDAIHLDRTPRMRFIDVVDVEASNRASLLFELRGQNSRQFGLYRVIASHSDQIFLTGTTQ